MPSAIADASGAAPAAALAPATSTPPRPTAGAAWFDDVVLRALGPTDESVTDPLHAVINHLHARTAGPVRPAIIETAPPSNITVLNLGVIP
jgi:hypothetical protein